MAKLGIKTASLRRWEKSNGSMHSFSFYLKDRDTEKGLISNGSFQMVSTARAFPDLS